MPGTNNLTKPCCGSVCVVAGAEKCCEHEVREQGNSGWYYASNQNEPAVLMSSWTRRFFCPTCQYRMEHQGRFVQHHFSPLRFREVRVERPVRFFVTKKSPDPPLAGAVVKPGCRHYCRQHNSNNDGESCCCYCGSNTDRFYMCDCCLGWKREKQEQDRHWDRPAPRYRVVFGRSRRRTGSKKSALPALNNPMMDDLSVCLAADDLLVDWCWEEEEQEVTPDTILAFPLLHSFKTDKGSLVALSDDGEDWPALGASERPGRMTRQPQEVDFVDDESVIWVVAEGGDLKLEEDEWEMLSCRAGQDNNSVWSIDSNTTFVNEIKGGSTTSRASSFRDALLSPPSLTSPLVASHPALKSAKPTIMATNTNGRGRGNGTNDRRRMGETSNSGYLLEGEDFLASLRDEYKTTRGGKATKLYHRERKQRCQYWPTWDQQSRHQLRRKTKQYNKRQCHRLVAGSCY